MTFLMEIVKICVILSCDIFDLKYNLISLNFLNDHPHYTTNAIKVFKKIVKFLSESYGL